LNELPRSLIEPYAVALQKMSKTRLADKLTGFFSECFNKPEGQQ